MLGVDVGVDCERSAMRRQESSFDALVIGAGSLGASAAFHLVERGLRVALIDRYGPVEETSLRAAGMGMEIQADDALSAIGQLAIKKLMAFETDTGQPLEVFQPGSIKVARAPSDIQQIHDEVRRGKAMGVDVDYVTPDTAKRLAPWFAPSGALTMWHARGDIYLEPAELPLAYLAAFAARGGSVLQRHTVLDFESDRSGLTGVITDRGRIGSTTVVLAAGAWTPVLAERAGTRVAMWPVRHQLMITAPLAGVSNDQPAVRFMDARTYVRPYRGALMFGTYEPDPLQVDLREQRSDYRIDTLPIEPAPLQRQLAEVLAHFPRLADATWEVVRGALPTMTPDGRFLVGPLSEIPGLWIIGGCNVGGLSTSPALGQHLADWIVEKTPPDPIRPFNPGRFGDRWTDPDELRRACLATYLHKYSDAEVASAN
jgi:glycine/D-amino acid oxidase-like deaminating enzyme